MLVIADYVLLQVVKNGDDMGLFVEHNDIKLYFILSYELRAIRLARKVTKVLTKNKHFIKHVFGEC